MKPLRGRMLSQKDSARLSMLDLVGREKLIEAIAARIRKVSNEKPKPKDWYR